MQAIWLIGDDLGGDIIWCAAERLSFLSQVAELHSETKVYDFNLIGLRKQNVRQLEVTVHDPSRLHELYSDC